MTYDPADRAVVIFGGLSWRHPSGAHLLGDTWEYRNGVWHQMHPVTSPSPRYLSSMTFDYAIGKVVLFGGTSPGTGWLNDTWTYSAGNWSRLSIATAPSVRSGESIAYFPPLDAVILFGGYNGSCLNDTWELVSGVWIELHPSGSPPRVTEFAMTYDPLSSSILVFGGLHVSTWNVAYNTTWKFNGNAWMNASAATPSALTGRWSTALAFDPAIPGAVMYGGEGYLNPGSTASWGDLNDTWLYSGGAWKPLSPASNPGVLTLGGICYDKRLHELVLFGGVRPQVHGISGVDYEDTTWSFA